MIPCLIPARGGSKGVRLKNLRKIGGKSLIQIAVDVLKSSRYETAIWVSSDNHQILGHSKTIGALAHLRSAENSGDEASTDDVIDEWLSFLSTRGSLPEFFALVQPTNPSIKRDWLDNCVERYLILTKTHQISTVFTAAKFHGFVWKPSDNGTALIGVNHNHQQLRQRRQDIDQEQMFENGSIYVINTKDFIDTKNRFGRAAACVAVNDKLPEIDSMSDYNLFKTLTTKNHFQDQNFSDALRSSCKTGLIFLALGNIFWEQIFEGFETLSSHGKTSREMLKNLSKMKSQGHEIVALFEEKICEKSRQRFNQLGLDHYVGKHYLDAVIDCCDQGKKLISGSVIFTDDPLAEEAMSLVGLSICPSYSCTRLLSAADIKLECESKIGFFRLISRCYEEI